MTPATIPRLHSNRENKTAGLFYLQSESGELFGEFPSRKSAFSFLQRSGLEWEPLLIVSAESVRSIHKLWMPCPLPLSALQRTSLQPTN